MKQEMFVIIAYDIISDRRRDRVVKVLKNYGKRVNYSVFECLIETDIYQEVRETLLTLIKEKEDSVLMYQICTSCKQKMDHIGIKKTKNVRDNIMMF